MQTTEVTKALFRDPKPTAERVVQLAQRVLNGDILLPRFQRNFVWERRQILELLDSISRNYPIGSVLLWQSRQQLAHERSIADLKVAEAKPDYPVNYLLDGQQRLSTVCGVLHWEPKDPTSIWNVAYDLKQDKFLYLDSLDEPALHIIPLRYLNKPSSFFPRVSSLEESLQEKAKRIYDRFTDYHVAVVTLGDMSIGDVAPIFERINSTGKSLTIVDLMRAATWSPTFDLVDSVDRITESLKPKNFHELDRKTILRTVASAAGYGFSKDAIDDLRRRTEAELLQDVSTTESAARLACDFLATQIGAPNSRALPYTNQFVVLCEIFRLLPTPNTSQLEAITRWFWRTTFGEYFGGWNTGQMNYDRTSIAEFAQSNLAEIPTSATAPTASVWSLKNFRANSAISKMHALMLGHFKPLDILNGQAIDVSKALAWSNDKDFHHFFPKAYLSRTGEGKNANVIANIIMLTSASNLTIRDSSPAKYLSDIVDQVGRSTLLQRLSTNMITEDCLDAAIAEDFDSFIDLRSKHLQSEALRLAGLSTDGTEMPLIEEGTADPTDS